MTWRGAASVVLVAVAATAAILAQTPAGERRGPGAALPSPGRVETLRRIDDPAATKQNRPGHASGLVRDPPFAASANSGRPPDSR